LDVDVERAPVTHIRLARIGRSTKRLVIQVDPDRFVVWVNDEGSPLYGRADRMHVVPLTETPPNDDPAV
jgi:hypothetical protein